MKRALKARLRQRIVVTLKTGEAFDGLLWEIGPDVWVLRGASAVGLDEPVPVDGEVLVLVSTIVYAQRPVVA